MANKFFNDNKIQCNVGGRSKNINFEHLFDDRKSLDRFFTIVEENLNNKTPSFYFMFSDKQYMITNQLTFFKNQEAVLLQFMRVNSLQESKLLQNNINKITHTLEAIIKEVNTPIENILEIEKYSEQEHRLKMREGKRTPNLTNTNPVVRSSNLISLNAPQQIEMPKYQYQYPLMYYYHYACTHLFIMMQAYENFECFLTRNNDRNKDLFERKNVQFRPFMEKILSSLYIHAKIKNYNLEYKIINDDLNIDIVLYQLVIYNILVFILSNTTEDKTEKESKNLNEKPLIIRITRESSNMMNFNFRFKESNARINYDDLKEILKRFYSGEIVDPKIQIVDLGILLACHILSAYYGNRIIIKTENTNHEISFNMEYRPHNSSFPLEFYKPLKHYECNYSKVLKKLYKILSQAKSCTKLDRFRDGYIALNNDLYDFGPDICKFQ